MADDQATCLPSEVASEQREGADEAVEEDSFASAEEEETNTKPSGIDTGGGGARGDTDKKQGSCVLVMCGEVHLAVC